MGSDEKSGRFAQLRGHWARKRRAAAKKAPARKKAAAKK
jgi:hypothetical protein